MHEEMAWDTYGHTKSCAAVSGVTTANATAAGDDGVSQAITDQHDSTHRTAYDHIFSINASLDIYNNPLISPSS